MFFTEQPHPTTCQLARVKYAAHPFVPYPVESRLYIHSIHERSSLLKSHLAYRVTLVPCVAM